jgi:hypothetical protein
VELSAGTLETARASELRSRPLPVGGQQGRRALCRMRRSSTLVRAFWEQAELFPLCDSQ